MEIAVKWIVRAAAVAAVTLTIGATTASALTCTFGRNANQTTTYSLSANSAEACGVGNDSVSALGAITGVFAAPPAWTLAFKTDSSVGGTHPLTGSFTGTGLSLERSREGSWTISSFPVLTQIAIVLKAGNNFAAFLLTPFGTTGNWTTSRNLSHASIYYRSCAAGALACGEPPPPPPPPVPLPAAGWMLLAGLGGLAALRRRRKG